jgi:hypothetical protein
LYDKKAVPDYAEEIVPVARRFKALQTKNIYFHLSLDVF